MKLTDTDREKIVKLGEPPMDKAAYIDHSQEIIGWGRDAQGYWLRREWYVPESYDDDDLSMGGFILRPRMGSARRYDEHYYASWSSLLAAL